MRSSEELLEKLVNENPCERTWCRMFLLTGGLILVS